MQAGLSPVLRFLLAVICVILALLQPGTKIQANAGLIGSSRPYLFDEANKDARTITTVTQVEATRWQLMDWKNGQVICEIYSRADSGPAAQEVINSCGNDVYLNWITTPVCKTGPCKGLMLRFLGKEKHTFSDVVTLPKISFKVETGNCTPGQVCDRSPVLTLTATEPVKDFQITNIHVRTTSQEARWDGADCRYELPQTGEEGQWIEYWADSNFGDESDHVLIKYRNVRLDPDAAEYRLDILGSGWAQYAPSGSLIWFLFPPVDGSLDKTFDQPLSAHYLYTTNRYTILAGQLIKNGVVDAKECPGGGVFESGVANACGEQLAAEPVLAWQNKYDAQIYAAALRYNVPARVIKGIIAQETQFWGGPDDPNELGLGKLTENGVEMLLTWNPKYFLSVCIPHYQSDRCSSGYDGLSDPEKLVLKGDVWKKIGTDEEFDLLAATLLASAAQINQVVENSAQMKAEAASNYQDMWEMTIANYYSGSGCINSAVLRAVSNKTAVSWVNVSNELQGSCAVAVDYVERVMDLSN